MILMSRPLGSGKTSPEVAGKKMRARGRAQQRAFMRLKNENVETYKKYYKEEVEKAFLEEGLLTPEDMKDLMEWTE